MLVRTDPDEHRIALLLSIPRDLRVEIPGSGLDKVNAAYAFGGPTLAIRTVQALTGIPINHVVVVSLLRFKEVIDTLGGVTIDVPSRSSPTSSGAPSRPRRSATAGRATGSARASRR